MKRNSIVKSIALSVALSVVLVGCGGSEISSDASSDDEAKEKVVKDDIKSLTINGKAVDGYLQYATVCLDLSQDGYCQEGEPTAQTTENGSYKLEINPDIQEKDTFLEAMLLVYGGKDVDTGEDFRGKLLAPRETEVVNISPLTTLVAKAVQKELKKDTKLTKQQMKEKVKEKKEKIAKIFDIRVEDITKDPVAEKDTNPKLIKEALKIQKAVEAMSGASKNSDTLEEVYEKLVEKLANVEDARGINSLLDVSFKNEGLLKAAKAINKNIEKSFEKFEGDLEKVAFITKEDLKKIKEERFDEIEIGDEDDIFKDGFEWDKAFIKSSLEDIGIDNPTKEQIQKIKDDIDDINPRVILENIKKFEDSEDSTYKEIFEKIKEQEEAEKKAKQFEKAENDGEIVKFEKGMSFFEFYPSAGEYEEVKLGDNFLVVKDFIFRDNEFVEYPIYENEEKSYVLRNGKWIEKNEEKNLAYTIDDDGVMTFTDERYKVTILNQEDISKQERYSVVMPEGSLVSVLQIEQLEDQYNLYGEMFNRSGDYSSISNYVKVQCEVAHYKTSDGKSCDQNTKEGEVKGGKWSIQTHNEMEMLIEKDNYNDDYTAIFAMKDETLHAGGVSYKNIRLEHYINDVAMNAYKKAMIDGEMPMFKAKTPPITMPIIEDNDNTSSIVQGKAIYTSQCVSCHGERADANALGSGAIIANNIDNVAQLLKGYKYSSLNQYENGTTMQGVADSLTDEDIESIALYIKSL